MKPSRRSAVFCIFVSMQVPLAAQSTYIANAGNWSTAASWNPAGVPAAGANITLSNASTGTLTLDGATSRTIGSYTHGDAGTRTAVFDIQTNSNTLTFGGGLTANGAFGGVGLRLRGNHVVSANQVWQIAGGLGSVTSDHGVTNQEISSGNRGTLTLNSTLTKNGSGQLMVAGTTISGAGDLVVNEGAFKLNAGSSLELQATGPGKFVLNNNSSLFFSKNSGTFGNATTFNRPFQLNGTANIVTGGNGAAGPWTIHSPMEWNGSHNVTLNNSVGSGTPAMNYHFAGVMSGSGGFTKLGPGQLFLSGTGSNTLSGLVTASAGELRLAKTGSATAIAGDLLITGGLVRMDQPNQIADTSNVTVTGGQFVDTAGHADTIASINISSTATSSLSNITVTGATTLSNGIHDVNTGFSFTTQSLAISNNAAIRHGANAAGTTINVGAGGLTLDNGRVIFGSAGGAVTALLNLSGNVVSTGTSLLTAPNYNGPRITDLQAGSRTFAVNDGVLDIQTTVQNGTLVKSGAGLLRLSRAGSTADFSMTGGPVEIAGPIDAGGFLQGGGSLLMDIGGTNPAKITTSGDFAAFGGSIEVSVLNGALTPGVLELVRYGGNLTGTPVVNLSPLLIASRMAPVVSLGSGLNDAITVVTTDVPAELVWHGGAGSLWDINSTSNFDSGSKTFYQLDKVIFDDTGTNPNIQLDSAVFPSEVEFDHGITVPTYTLSGSGSISGPAKLIKWGTGTTIIATDNDYTGVTEINQGLLRVGNGGATGSLGSGAIVVASGATLEFARSGVAVLPNAISGAGAILQSGPGTLVIPSNQAGFTGTVSITGGILQLGNGGTDGSLGTAPIDIGAGATLAVRRSGVQTVPNALSGQGSVTILEGSTVFSGANTHTGGFTVTDGGVLRITADASLGALPGVFTPNAVRLTNGGLKNQDSDPVTDALRGITINGEAYFTAGWTKTLTVNGPLTGTGDVFINYDSGRVILADPTSDWVGVLTLGASKPGFNGTTGGNLEITSVSNGGSASPLGAASADPANIVFNGGRLIYNGANGSTNRGFTLQGSGTIEVPTSNLEFGGVVTGPGSLTKAGAGTLILGGNSDFTGLKTLTAGAIVLKSTTGLGGTGSNIIFTGTTGVLELATDTSVAPYPVTIGVGNSGTILSGVGTPGPGINHTLGNLTLSSITLNVGASSNVSGGSPRVTFGDLNLSAGSAGTTTLNPTTADLTLGTASITSGAFNKTLTLGGTSQDNQVTGTLSDGLAIFSLRKENTSLWTVSGDNTFTGSVAANNGVLAITHTNALGSTGKTVTIAGNAANGQIPELRMSGGISPTVAILTLSGNGVAATGVLRNVSGDNTLTATTQVNLGSGNGNTTLYSDSGTLTLNSPLIAANAVSRALILAGPGNGVVNGPVADGTTVNLPVTKTGAGTWALNGAHTYTGSTTVQAGVLSLGQASLDDASTVNIDAGAVLDLNFSGIDDIAALNLGGNPVGPDTYNAAHPVYGSYFSGTGSIRVPVTATPFEQWISTNYPSLTGPDAEAGADPDYDGVANLLEFILNGNPTSSSSLGVSVHRIADTNATAGDELILVVAMRKNAVFAADGNGQAQEALVDGVQCRIEGSADLTAFTAEVETLALPLPAALTSGLPALAPGDAWEYRAFRLKNSDGLPNEGFLRLKATTVDP